MGEWAPAVLAISGAVCMSPPPFHLALFQHQRKLTRCTPRRIVAVCDEHKALCTSD